MKFIDYINSLNIEQKRDYASRVGMRWRTLYKMYINERSVPRSARMSKLIEESKGAVTHDEMLEHFYNLRNF